MLRTVWKKPSIRCTPNGNQARARSRAPRGNPQHDPGWRRGRSPGTRPGRTRPGTRQPRRPAGPSPGHRSSHLVRRSSSTRPRPGPTRSRRPRPPGRAHRRFRMHLVAGRDQLEELLVAQPLEQEDATQVVNEHQPHLPGRGELSGARRHSDDPLPGTVTAVPITRHRPGETARHRRPSPLPGFASPGPVRSRLPESPQVNGQ